MLQSCKQHESVLQTALRGKKLKATPGRMAVLDIFTHNEKPLSIKELKVKVGSAGPDTATLYRNAESLTLEGLLIKVNLGGKNASYELASRKHHHHLVCVVCGKIEELEGCKVSSPNAGVVKNKSFSKILRHSLEYFGLCGKCG